MYDDFAGVYDALMDDYDYDAWSEHYLSLIRAQRGSLPVRMAECACGTGSLFEMQRAVYGNDEHMMAAACSAGHESFEGLVL